MLKYVYDAWGKHAVKDNNGRVITSGIGVLNPFGYRGYYYDTETGLYYLQTRYYDPELGRFISQDSIDYADPETINGLNLYAYCGNNPVMNVDPTGTLFLLCLLIGLAVGAVVGATVSGVKAAQAGATGWELFGAIVGGAVIGGALGAVAGAVVGLGAVMISSGLSMIGAAGGLMAALAGGGTMATAALAGIAVVGAGAIVVGAGGAIVGVFLSQWIPRSWPGDDPTIPPGDGFEWKGRGPIGSDKGAWVNRATGDFLHPDLNHPAPIGPHWDWVNKILKIAERIFPL